MPAQLTELLSGAAHGWQAMLFVAGVALLAWGAYMALSGVEGWMLSASLRPLLVGFLFGCVLMFALIAPWFPASVAFAGFFSGAAQVALGALWIFLLIVCLAVGVLLASACLGLFWYLWWLWIFLAGGAIGLAVYFAVIAWGSLSAGTDAAAAVIAGEFAARTAADGWAVNWPGVARAAIAFGAGGAVYTLAYRFFCPLIWLLRNAVLVATGVTLVAVAAVRTVLADFLAGSATPKAFGEVVLGKTPILVGVFACAFVITAYAMYIQRFGRSLGELLARVAEAKNRAVNILRTLGCSAATTGATLGGMLTLRQFAEPRCRALPRRDDADDDEDDEPPRRKSGKKKKA